MTSRNPADPALYGQVGSGSRQTGRQCAATDDVSGQGAVRGVG